MEEQTVARKAIDLHGELTEVFDDIEKEKKPGKGFAYIHNGMVYVYKGKRKKKDPVEPASVYKNGDEYLWVDPPEDDLDEYRVSRVFPLTLEGIYEETKDRARLKKIDPVMIEQSDNFFAPRIIPQDDALKVIIKKVLAELRCNIKPVGDNKDKSTWEMINNLKSNLTNPDTRMSILYFAKWCWVLGLDCNITVRAFDNEGKEFEVRENLRYNYNIR